MNCTSWRKPLVIVALILSLLISMYMSLTRATRLPPSPDSYPGPAVTSLPLPEQHISSQPKVLSRKVYLPLTAKMGRSLLSSSIYFRVWVRVLTYWFLAIGVVLLFSLSHIALRSVQSRFSLISRTHGKGKTLTSAAVIICYALLSICFTYPLIRHMNDRLIGNSYHCFLSAWDLWWTRYAVLKRGVPLFYTSHLYYPKGVSLLFHTLNPLYGVISIPLQLAFGLVIAHNCMYLLSFIAAGYTCYLLVHHLTRDRMASFLSGVAFTFSAYHMIRATGHINLMAIEWLPLYALFLLRAKEDICSAIWAGIMLTLVLWCDLHYVLYCVLFTLVFGIHEIVANRQDRQVIFRLTRALVVIAIAFLLVSAPVLVPMLKEALQSDVKYMHCPYEESVWWSADLLSYIIPGEYHFAWADLARPYRDSLHQGKWESHNFLGYVSMALATGAILVSWRRSKLWVYSLSTFLILSLGPVLHINGKSHFTSHGIQIQLPYALLYRLPFVGIARVPGRMSIMVMLSIAVLAGLYVARLNSQLKGKRLLQRIPWPPILTIILTAAIYSETLPIPFPTIMIPHVPDFYYNIAKDRDFYGIFEIPYPVKHNTSEDSIRALYQFYQTIHQKGINGGFHARPPHDPLLDDPVVSSLSESYPVSSTEVISVLPDAYRYIVVHKNMALESKWKEAFQDISPFYEDEDIVVWEISR